MRIETRAFADGTSWFVDSVSRGASIPTLEELSEVRRPPLLFALDEDAHADRRLSVERADRSGVDDDAALVVRRPAAVEPSVLLDRLERLGMPELPRAGRLDVVMRVEQDGRSAGRSLDPAEDRGHAFDLDDLRLDARVTQDFLGRRCRSAELRRIVAGVADRGNAHERFEVNANPRHERAHPLAQRYGGSLCLHRKRRAYSVARRSAHERNAAGSISLREALDTARALTRCLLPKLNARI